MAGLLSDAGVSVPEPLELLALLELPDEAEAGGG